MLFHTTLVGILPSLLRLVSGVRNRLPFSTRCCWSHRKRTRSNIETGQNRKTANLRRSQPHRDKSTPRTFEVSPIVSCEVVRTTPRTSGHLHLLGTPCRPPPVLSSNSHGGFFLPWLKERLKVDCKSPGRMSCKRSILPEPKWQVFQVAISLYFDTIKRYQKHLWHNLLLCRQMS